jgi:glucokinase
MNLAREFASRHNRFYEATSGMTQPQTRSIITAQLGDLATEDTGYVAGIDIGGTNLRLVLADMRGAVVAKCSASTTNVRDANAVMTLISDGVRRLLREVSAPRGALRAVAAGAPGITDVDAGIVIATSYLMGWRDVPLRAMLEDALDAPAVVDNDVNLAAIGESWVGAAKGARDFVFLAIGTGIGAGIVLNGSPFRGMNWAAGEIGYMLVPGIPDTPYNHGKPGALESVIGGEGIKAQWRSLWSADSTALPKDLTATEIFDHALAGDSLAQTILDRSARLLSHVIYDIGLVLSCPLFLLGGGVGTHKGFCDATQNMLAQRNMRNQPVLRCSTLGADAQIMGALRLALDTAGARPVHFANE